MIDLLLKSSEGQKIIKGIIDAYHKQLEALKSLDRKIDDLNFEVTELNKKLSKKG